MSNETENQPVANDASAPDQNEPIDAHFEPAQETMQRKSGKGPGWLGVVIASVMAAGAGGALGIVGAKAASGNGGNAPAGLSDRVAALSDQQAAIETRLAQLGRDQTELGIALRDEIQKLPVGESTASLTPLLEELDKVSKRLDEAVAAGGNGAGLAALQARLEALEAVEPGGEVTDEQTQRTLAALSARADQLEASLRAVREAAPKDEERLTRLETRLANLQSGLSTATSANSQDSEKLTGLIEQMRAEEAAARKRAELATQSAEAALALVSIETAAAQGNSFETEYRKLRTLMPRSEDVRRLATFAGRTPPTLADLKATFQPASVEARNSVPTTDKGALGWLSNVFGDAVRVREAGDGAVVSAALESATSALAKDDLVAARDAVSALTGPPANALADWTEAANRRISLDQALEAARLAVTLGDIEAP